MKFNRKLIATGAVLLTAAILSGCATTNVPGEKEKVELSMLVFTTPNLSKDFWNSQVATASSSDPNVSVKLLYSPDPDRIAYTKQLFATNQAPDISWDVVPELVQAGDLVPYPKSAFSDFITLPGSVGGKYYGVPAGSQVVPLVYYNPTLFKAAGIESVPTTWDEFVAAAEKLKASGVTPILLGGASDTWTSGILLDGILSIDLLGQDKDWVAKLQAGDAAWTDDNVVASISKWKKLVDDGLTNSDALSLTYTQMQEKFLAGKVGMYPMGSWAAAIKSPNFDLKVFALPGKSGASVAPIVIGNSQAVAKSSKHPKAAQDLSIKLATNQSFVEAWLKNDALFPTVKGFKVPADTPQIVKDSFAIYQGAAKQVFALNWGNSGDSTLPSAFTAEYYKIVQRMILNQITPKTAGEQMQAAWVASTAR